MIMRVAILQCDLVLEKFQPEFGSYSLMIQQMFKAIDAPVEFEIFDCQQEKYPSDINDFDFYITTGSKASVYEDLPWIKQLIDFVKQLDEQKKKLIGICFGHQIIAMALGANVEKSSKGWGVGVAQNEMVNFPEWMIEKKSELNIIVSHQDQVENIPEETKVIAKTEFCPNFMLQWNSHFLSVQGHPEWNTHYSNTLMEDRREVIGDVRIDKGVESLSVQPDNLMFTRWIMSFVKA